MSDLPSHLLLYIVHSSFPQAPDRSYNKLERQRKTLHWLATSLRLVNRTFYLGKLLQSTHVLYSTRMIAFYLFSRVDAENEIFYFL
jgi:hypothetical protein